MASASVKTTTVTKMVQAEVTETQVTLVLTEDEAKAVKFLVARVKGRGAFRDAVTPVYSALDEAGVDQGDKVYWDNYNSVDSLNANKVKF